MAEQESADHPKNPELRHLGNPDSVHDDAAQNSVGPQNSAGSDDTVQADTGNTVQAAPAVVVDTSVFANPDSRALVGSDTAEALDTFFHLARRGSLAVYMPRSVFDELSHFIGEEQVERIRGRTTVRGPDL